MKRRILGTVALALASAVGAEESAQVRDAAVVLVEPAPVTTQAAPADSVGPTAAEASKPRAGVSTESPIATAAKAPPPMPALTLEERVARLEAQLKSAGLLDLLAQMQGMRDEIARLRGGLEESSHLQKLAEKRQKELFADLDERQTKQEAARKELEARLQELANRTLSPKEAVRLQTSQSLAAAAPVPDAESESKGYEAALAQFKVGNYTASVEAFQSFLKLHPSGTFASNALYWLGLSYFSLGDFKSAAAAQLRLLRDHPQSAKVPDSMVSLARAQVQLGETEAARGTLEQVLEKYPVTRAAEAARKLLALMK
jgi:tol-pal system protein YbgF